MPKSNPKSQNDGVSKGKYRQSERFQRRKANRPNTLEAIAKSAKQLEERLWSLERKQERRWLHYHTMYKTFGTISPGLAAELMPLMKAKDAPSQRKIEQNRQLSDEALRLWRRVGDERSEAKRGKGALESVYVPDWWMGNAGNVAVAGDTQAGMDNERVENKSEEVAERAFGEDKHDDGDDISGGMEGLMGVIQEVEVETQGDSEGELAPMEHDSLAFRRQK